MSLTAGDRERLERLLKRNIYKRDQAVEQISILMGVVNSTKSEQADIAILQPRLDDLEMLITDVRLYQDSILDGFIELDRDSEFITTHHPIGKLALEQYYTIKSICNEIGLTKQNPVSPPTTRNIQLPRIELPSFDGNILHWRAFRDTFVSLVHDNDQVPPIQKFHHLLSAVSGSAAATVKSVPLIEANYPIVWQNLNDRFDNKRVLLGAHMDTLFRVSPIKTESLVELNSFLTTFQENIEAINALEVDDFPGFFLFYLAARILDPVTRQAFEFEYHAAEVPTFDMLAEFVRIRCQMLQNSSKHSLYQCPKFIQQNAKQRFRLVKSNRLCTNCLSSSHKTSDCESTYTCRHCALKHHSLLHLETAQTRKNSCPTNKSNNVNQSTPTPSATPVPTVSNTTDSVPFVGTSSSKTNVVLGTAVIRIRNNCGQLSPVRVLIDTGSQISVITTACVSRLGIKRRHCNTAVTGLSQTSVSTTKGSTNCTLLPRHSTSPEIYCEPVILSRITGPMPNVLLPSNIRTTYSHLTLADPHFDVPGHIDFLLGADIYPYILGQSCQVLHTSNCPSAFETRLGWIIVGQSSADSRTPPVSLLLTPEPSIDHLIQQFWAVEEPVPTNSTFTTDQQCEDHFIRTTTRDSTGRYSLALPFSIDPSCLGDSRDMAISRFYNLERKLLKDPQDEITEMLGRGGFELKKWSSNCKELLSKVPNEDQANSLCFDPKDDAGVRILGLHWNPAADTFTYHTSSIISNIHTKRSVLSTIAKLYDPLGALAPIIFWAKCFMQLLWQAGLQWDEPLPSHLIDLWKQYESELHMVSGIKICRHIPTEKLTSVQLIGFSDASEKGYAAVVYLRTIHQDGRVLIHFITAKSKVSPSKTSNTKTTLTIPRLELGLRF
ncbi:unnamed protein product [Macrosiphum euphorbiae]|uniref:Peptidase aspartic putative domain-containing protein n=1 Tax=Macrosiphum euphorbiae TaxID=13131 RepID=A0AAV0WYA0_9HEMI|nr:unnamed protein product [Macrosiphum euphorbiae]